MGKEIRGVPEASALTVTGVGHYLASQRRLRGISLDELAAVTKIPRRSLERLESGVFDSASDGFVRGFVRAVAASLGLDPDEAVMRLMDEPEEVAPAARFGAAARKWLGASLALACVLLVLAGLWFLVAGWFEPGEAAQSEDVILRRDPVRSLARESAMDPAGDTVPVTP